MLRAKMNILAVVPNGWGGFKVMFQCQYDNTLSEDQKFQKATPSGTAEFTIDNPSAFEQLVPGGNYYFDISPADDRTRQAVEREKLVKATRDHLMSGGKIEMRPANESVMDELYRRVREHIAAGGAIMFDGPGAPGFSEYQGDVTFKALPATHTEGTNVFPDDIPGVAD